MQLTVASALGLLVGASLSSAAALPLSPPASPVKRSADTPLRSPEKRSIAGVFFPEDDVFGKRRLIARSDNDSATVNVTTSTNTTTTGDAGNGAPLPHGPTHGSYNGTMTHLHHNGTGSLNGTDTNSTMHGGHHQHFHHHPYNTTSLSSSSTVSTSTGTSTVSTASINGQTGLATQSTMTTTSTHKGHHHHSTTKKTSSSATSSTVSKHSTKKHKKHHKTSTKARTSTSTSTSTSSVAPTTASTSSTTTQSTHTHMATHKPHKEKYKTDTETEVKTKTKTKTKTRTHTATKTKTATSTPSATATSMAGSAAFGVSDDSSLPIIIHTPGAQSTAAAHANTTTSLEGSSAFASSSSASNNVTAVALYGQAQKGYLYASWLDALNRTRGEYVGFVKSPKPLAFEGNVTEAAYGLALKHKPSTFYMVPIVANASIPVYAQPARALLEIALPLNSTTAVTRCAGWDGKVSANRTFVSLAKCENKRLVDLLLSQDISNKNISRLMTDFGYLLQIDNLGQLMVSPADKPMLEKGVMNVQLSFTTMSNMASARVKRAEEESDSFEEE